MEQSGLVDEILSAIRDGCNVSEIENLLSKPGVNDVLKSDSGQKILDKSLNLGLTNISSLLISHGVDCKPVKPKENSYLHIAIMNRDTNFASQLIEIGASIEAVDSDENTPLLLAIYMDDADMVKLLLEKGALISYRERKKPSLQSPLLLAVERNRLDVIKNMFEFRSQIPMKEIQQAMYTALYNGLDSILHFFVAANIDLDEAIGKSTTILHLSAKFGCAATVKYILDQGTFPVNALDQKLRSPLHCVCLNCPKYITLRQTETLRYIMELLIERGAEIDLIDYSGMTPLMYTMKSHNHLLAYALLNSNANTNILKNSETIFFWALECDLCMYNYELAERILKRGGYKMIDHINDSGFSPLTKIIQMNKQSYASTLLKYFPDLEGEYFDGRKIYKVLILDFGHRELLQQLKMYLYFMQNAKLYLSPECVAELQALLPGEPLPFRESIAEERKSLKSIQLDEYLTALDIVVKPLFSLLPVFSIVTGDLPFLKEHPHHENIILKKVLCLERKKERLDLIHRASSCLQDVLDISLPVVVIDLICQHLSNYELTLLLS